MNAILIGRGDWGRKLESYITKGGNFNILATYGRDFSIDRIPNGTKVAFIATPLDSHFPLALECLKSNLHVFIEKPTCKSIEQIQTLYNQADIHNNRIIYTDYTYLTSPSILAMQNHLNDIGRLQRIESTLTQYGKFYKGENVMEILGVHFLSIFAYLFGDVELVACEHSDLYNATLTLKTSGTPISFYCSICDSDRSRKIHIIGQEGEIIFNMLDPSPLKLIQQGKLVKSYNFDESNNISNTLALFSRFINDRFLYEKHRELCFVVLRLLLACI